MDADMVLVAERFALRVDGDETDLGRVERVDAVVGRTAGVGRLAGVKNFLADEAVRRAADVGLDRRLLLAFGRRGVLHDHHVDVVHQAAVNELLFAAEHFDLPLAAQPAAVAHLDELLGGHGHQRHVAAQFVHDAAVVQRVGHAGQRGDHAVMPAHVRGARLGIGEGAVGHAECVQLAHHRDLQLLFLAADLRDHARDALFVGRRVPQGFENFFDLLRRLELLPARLGLGENAVAQRRDPVAIPIDDPARQVFQFLFRHEI